jgi:hypothetical protein
MNTIQLQILKTKIGLIIYFTIVFTANTNLLCPYTVLNLLFPCKCPYHKSHVPSNDHLTSHARMAFSIRGSGY